jgi:predicted SnoaL-like aldol condensation-catalyzing enzyme
MINRNRAIVTSFADLFYRERRVREAFEGFVADKYVQHNPGIADGREAAIEALTPLFSRADMQFNVKRILVDGDYAAIHLHAIAPDTPRGTAVVDLFRLEGGKIVEHWDVLQSVPPESKNPHPMF